MAESNIHNLDSSGNVQTSDGGWTYHNMANGTALIKTGAGKLGGITINSHTSGTMVIADALSMVAPLIHGTITFAAGERTIDFQSESFSTGLYVEIGGTANVTLRYK